MQVNKVVNRDGAILAILLLITFQPYFTWFFPISLTGLSTYISFFFFFKYKKKSIEISTVILFILYIFVSIRGGFSIFGTITNLCVATLLLTDNDFIIIVFDKFRKIFSVVIGISLLVFILVIFFKIALPYQILEPLNSNKNEVYYHAYPFLTMYYSYGIPLLRFCGLFDEPGVVGTISGALLVLSRFDLKDKYNIPILLSGLFSASLFFIAICFLYIIIVAKGKYKFMGVIFFLILLIIASKIELTQDLIVDRLVYEDGGFAGDSRSSHLSETWYNNFIHSSSIYFGLGNNAHMIHNEGGCSYKDLIIDYGIIFFVLYALCFAIPAFKKQNFRDFLVFAIVFWGIIYQRPFITTLGYLFLLVLSKIASDIKSTNNISPQ